MKCQLHGILVAKELATTLKKLSECNLIIAIRSRCVHNEEMLHVFFYRIYANDQYDSAMYVIL